MANKKIQLMNSGGNDNLFPKTYCFPDWSNLIATTGTSYTATQDCFCTVFGYTFSAQIYIDGVSIIHSNSLTTYAGEICGPFYVGKGHTISYTSTQSGSGINAYGVTY